MRYDYSKSNPTYAAPFLGNGAITFQLGPDGSMRRAGEETLIRNNPTNCIWWEGRRYLGNQSKPLIPFGRFEDALGEAPLTACQELDPRQAEISCEARYSCGLVKTLAFVQEKENLIVLRKRLEPAGEMRYRFRYSFCGKGASEEKPALTLVSGEAEAGNGILRFVLTDREGYQGVVAACCQGQAAMAVQGHAIEFSVTVREPAELTFLLALADSLDQDQPEEYACALLGKAQAAGFDALRQAHAKEWQAYLAEGYALTGDAALDGVYETAQYHQKCFTTKWSLPVGLNDATWDGRFFGFDEYYMQNGLLTSNHMEAARRVPTFRRQGLPLAVHRASSRGLNQAHYPWEAVEDGTEASPPGFYYEHVFHMAAIPLSGWEYYRFTRDEAFLRDTVYPVLEACTQFFRDQMLYRVEGGKLIVGKCTDLERLGSSKANAYMTTCGVVATFRAYAKASRILGVHEDLAAACERLSAQLLEALPNDGSRYLPFPGCEQRSISAYSGTYPFDVIPRTDPMQARAIADYLEHEDVFGNMYAMGSGVCSWYACWKSIVDSRLGRPGDALAALRYVASTAGDFGELFEINNAPSKTYIRPWFTTAAGMYIHAVNEALLMSSDEGELFLLQGMDQTFQQVKFRLAARGDLVVEFEMAKGQIVRLQVSGGRHCRQDQVTVHLPEWLGGLRVVPVERN